MKRILMLLIAAIMNYGPPVLAVPQQINYQGYLTRTDGSPLDTTVAMTFALWNDGGDYIRWSETQPSVSVVNGLFSTRLGQVNPISEVVMDYSSTMQLEIQVGNDGPMVPRIPLSAVFYSRRVGTVDNATGGTISGKTNIGWSNSNSGDSAFVVGLNNTVTGNISVVSGGSNNTANGYYSTIGGGHGNTAGSDGTVAGGVNNVASGSSASIGGGFGNTASGLGSMVPGGLYNSANGAYSFCAGYSAHTGAEGVFAWADATGDLFSPGLPNSFNVRSSGGVRLYTNAAASIGAQLPANQTAWVAICDSTRKHRYGRVNTRDILEKVAQLPIETWSYKEDQNAIRHIGPMAQDFWNSFHLGESDTTISTLDPDGVALAAIQELKEENDNLKTRLAKLEALLSASPSVNLTEKGN